MSVLKFTLSDDASTSYNFFARMIFKKILTVFLLILISKYVPTPLRLAHPPAGDQNLNPLESTLPDDDIKHVFLLSL